MRETVASLQQGYAAVVDAASACGSSAGPAACAVHELGVLRVTAAIKSGAVSIAKVKKALLQTPAKLAKQYRSTG